MIAGRAKPANGSEIAGRHVFWAMFAFFAVIVAVNLTLAVFANTSWTGLVVANGYVESQRFNAALAEARRQNALGWTQGFGYRDGALRLILTDSRGERLNGFRVRVKLTRPFSDGQDREVDLPATGAGHYALQLAMDPGQWDARVTVRSSSGELMRRDYRLFVRPGS